MEGGDVDERPNAVSRGELERRTSAGDVLMKCRVGPLSAGDLVRGGDVNERIDARVDSLKCELFGAGELERESIAGRSESRGCTTKPWRRSHPATVLPR